MDPRNGVHGLGALVDPKFEPLFAHMCIMGFKGRSTRFDPSVFKCDIEGVKTWPGPVSDLSILGVQK